MFASMELNLSSKHSIEMVITDKSEWLISHRKGFKVNT